jgi:hypothetical protein
MRLGYSLIDVPEEKQKKNIKLRLTFTPLILIGVHTATTLYTSYGQKEILYSNYGKQRQNNFIRSNPPQYR